MQNMHGKYALIIDKERWHFILVYFEYSNYVEEKKTLIRNEKVIVKNKIDK